MEIKEFFYINNPSKRRFISRIHSLLRRADARGSADIIYYIWHISIVAGRAVIEVRK